MRGFQPPLDAASEALPSGFALRGLKPLQTHPRARPPTTPTTPLPSGENASTGFLGPLPGLR